MAAGIGYFDYMEYDMESLLDFGEKFIFRSVMILLKKLTNWNFVQKQYYYKFTSNGR